MMILVGMSKRIVTSNSIKLKSSFNIFLKCEETLIDTPLLNLINLNSIQSKSSYDTNPLVAQNIMYILIFLLCENVLLIFETFTNYFFVYQKAHVNFSPNDSGKSNIGIIF